MSRGSGQDGPRSRTNTMDLRALAATVDRIVGETGKVDTASLHAQLFAIHQALGSNDRATIAQAQPAVEQVVARLHPPTVKIP